MPPALPALSDPMFSGGDMPDPTFAEQLEQTGDLAGALLEWQRQAHLAKGSDRAMALFRTAGLLQKWGKHQEALLMFEQFGNEFPKHSRIPEALYRMSRSAEALRPGTGSEAFVNRLVSKYPDSVWASVAAYRQVWEQAQEGVLKTPPITDPRITELAKQLEPYLQPAADKKATIAAFVSVIPGAGHLWLGDWRTALTAFVLNMLFIWALVFALKNKHWPYAAVWGLVVSILYTGTLFSAYALGQRDVREARLIAMASMSELHPKEPETK